MPASTRTRWGLVVIGRNEGERLRRCVDSIRQHVTATVYVDSGSIDGSANWALEQGIEVVNLDMSRPFTAARARNAGFERLMALHPDLSFVHFLDGDCEVASGWLATVVSFMDANPQVAVACGRRRERFPQASMFNRQCDREWDTPVGEARACGGDAMFRGDAFRQAGGFHAALIAGEEPELCLRLRAAGWKVWRLAHDMTWHDAAILHWGQWWKRARRAGHAFAEGAWMHGRTPERHWVKETFRALAWGLCLPLLSLLLAMVWHPAALLLLLLYPLQVVRLALRHGPQTRTAWEGALLLVLARLPEAQGALTYYLRQLYGRQEKLIEYK